MSRLLQLQDPANFSLQYSNSIPATVMETVDGRNIYSVLTEIIVPVVFDKPIISVNISTTVPAGKKWKFAGSCNRVINTGIGESFADERKPLFLGKWNLIFFSEITADYTVTYLPPSWFINLNIGIYQYDGPDSSVIEDDLARIENKIDMLSP